MWMGRKKGTKVPKGFVWLEKEFVFYPKGYELKKKDFILQCRR